MSTTVKCASCNIVINELLSYVQNKISIITEDSLMKICLSSFSSDQIDEAKTLVFESLPDEYRKRVRKGQGKENRDLMDIISLFKVVDSDVMPVFVARDLEKLPPITFDHLDVSKLLKDLILVQSEIKNIKSSFVTITQLEEEVKSQLQNMSHSVPAFSIRNVNLKRGGTCVYQGRDSGPMGLSHLNDSSVRDPNDISEPGSSSPIGDLNYRSMVIENDCGEASKDIPTNKTLKVDCDRLKGEGAGRAVTCSTERAVEQACESSPAADNDVCNQLINSNKSTFANALLCSKDNNDDNEQGWTLIQKRRPIRNNRLKGKMGSSTVATEYNFRAADRKIPIFITNVHKGTSESDICKYIYGKTCENVILSKIVMKKQSDHNAYKFFVSASKLQLFLDEKLWPSGIIFRRFVHFKKRFSTETINVSDNGQYKKLNG